MTYTQTFPGTATVRGGVITSRFEYRTEKDWRVETLSNTSLPQEAGSWAEYQNDRMKRYDALLQRYEEYPAPPGGINVVDEWLIPRRADDLLQKGWTKAESGEPGVIRLVQTTDLPCVPDFPCIDGRRTERQVRTFDAHTGIPLSVRSEMNGKLAVEIKVVDLKVER